MKLFQIVVSNQQRSANSTCRTFREVSCAAKAAFRVRRHGETRRGRWRFHGGRGNASKPAVESTTPIADRRFAMPPGSWSRVAQLIHKISTHASSYGHNSQNRKAIDIFMIVFRIMSDSTLLPLASQSNYDILCRMKTFGINPKTITVANHLQIPSRPYNKMTK